MDQYDTLLVTTHNIVTALKDVKPVDDTYLKIFIIISDGDRESPPVACALTPDLENGGWIVEEEVQEAVQWPGPN